MEFMILLRAGLKRQKESIAGVFVLIFLVSLSLMTAITVSINSGRYIGSEMERLGYGDLTAWISGANNPAALTDELESLDGIEAASMQPLVFAGYRIGDAHSDNEGQLLAYDPDAVPYRILDHELKRYTSIDAIEPGSIYISPSLHSSYDIAVGDTVRFELARGSSGEREFTVAGYFEDPFMGSSMIDMKSFLIRPADFEAVLGTLQQTSDFDRLGRAGDMVHISQAQGSVLPTSTLNSTLNEQSGLGEFTEFVYSRSSIYGFMLILQNIFSGFLLVFALVLTLVALIVMGHSISSAIEQEYKDMGILKTMGCTTGRLRLVQISQYGVGIAGGLLLGLLCAIPVASMAAGLTVTSTGVLMPARLPIGPCILALIAIALLLVTFISIKTKRIKEVEPIRAIHGSWENQSAIGTHSPSMMAAGLQFRLALRQLLSGKKRYVGSFVVAVLLVFFSSLVGRMDAWLGPNGEGLMNAFSVAAHDLGVQPMGDVDMREIETLVSSRSPILDTYELAMESVTVNGVDYTANVIDQPERFHLLSGVTTTEDDQVVITEFVASDLNVTIGDSVAVSGNRGSETYTVVGIYKCANEMGANIGMNRDGYARIANVHDYIWCYHYILEDGSVNNAVMETLLDTYGVDLHVHTNSWSGLDGIVRTMHLLTACMYAIVAIMVFVVIALTSAKLLQTEQHDLAILKSIGFSSVQLRSAFAIRFAIVVAIGSAVGVVAGNVLADPVIAILLKLFGIGEFHSTFGFGSTILPALIVTGLFAVFAFVLSRKIQRVGLTELIQRSA